MNFMTRKDYVLIAKQIYDLVIEYRGDVKLDRTAGNPSPKGMHALNALNIVASRLGHAMRDDNANFDYYRFMEACGFREKDPTCVLCDTGEEHEH